MYCNLPPPPPPSLNVPATVTVEGFSSMMAPSPTGQQDVPPAVTGLVGSITPAPLMEQQQQQQQQQQMFPQHLQPQLHAQHHLSAELQAAPLQLDNLNGRVSFHDTRMEVRIASLACLSDELRNDIWYSPSDIDGMRTEVRDLCRFLRVNPQACPEEHTRGLELRISLERQCRKQLTVQGVVEAQRRCTDPAYIACLAQRCSVVPRDLALAQGQRDYSTVYATAAMMEGSVVMAPAESDTAAGTREAANNNSAPASAPTANLLNSCGMAPVSYDNMAEQKDCGNSRKGNESRGNFRDEMKNNQYMFSTCSRGQPGVPFHSQPAQEQQQYCQQQKQQLQLQHHQFHFQHQSYNGPCDRQENQQRQPTPFSDIDIATESDALFDPIMMEPIPFAASLPTDHANPSHHYQQHQQQYQQQQEQFQSLGAFFDDGNGKRSYDNSFVAQPATTATSSSTPSTTAESSVEDPQERMVRRRLEGSLNI